LILALVERDLDLSGPRHDVTQMYTGVAFVSIIVCQNEPRSRSNRRPVEGHGERSGSLNRSPDPDNEYFGDGLTEEAISDFARIAAAASSPDSGTVDVFGIQEEISRKSSPLSKSSSPTVRTKGSDDVRSRMPSPTTATSVPVERCTAGRRRRRGARFGSPRVPGLPGDVRGRGRGPPRPERGQGGVPGARRGLGPGRRPAA
jgi:hypothetical protein